MNHTRFDRSRQKLLGSSGTVSGVAVFGGASAIEPVSDEGESTTDQRTGGGLGLMFLCREHHSDWGADERQAAPGTRMVNALDDVELPDEIRRLLRYVRTNVRTTQRTGGWTGRVDHDKSSTDPSNGLTIQLPGNRPKTLGPVLGTVSLRIA